MIQPGQFFKIFKQGSDTLKWFNKECSKDTRLILVANIAKELYKGICLISNNKKKDSSYASVQHFMSNFKVSNLLDFFKWMWDCWELVNFFKCSTPWNPITCFPVFNLYFQSCSGPRDRLFKPPFGRTCIFWQHCFVSEIFVEVNQLAHH